MLAHPPQMIIGLVQGRIKDFRIVFLSLFQFLGFFLYQGLDPLTALTPPQSCVCSKREPGFTSIRVVFYLWFMI
jgi:hypothetical protein